ncbi:uncharacterized protein [Ptychodera flava]|uniref:uncharacterized protein n=1 Tax=Ptychodera flava TaxID=63121 RepID=UPI00396A382E
MWMKTVAVVLLVVAISFADAGFKRYGNQRRALPGLNILDLDEAISPITSAILPALGQIGDLQTFDGLKFKLKAKPAPTCCQRYAMATPISPLPRRLFLGARMQKSKQL